MPVYDYLCASCGRLTEVIHGIDAPGPRFCPACGAEGTLRKAFAPPTVHFKGSGWAKKDRSATRAPRAKPVGDSGEGTEAPAASGSGTRSGDAPSTEGVGQSGGPTKSKQDPGTGKGSPGAASAEG